MLVMMTTCAKAFSVALGILAILPALAVAGPIAGSSPPVSVRNVRVYPTEIVGNGEMTYPGRIALAFRNTSSTVITDVVFEVRSNNGGADFIHDAGTFSPGVDIKHEFLNQAAPSDAVLKVARVRFADGSAWIDTDVSNAW
jgi:hypothetical protein